MQTPKHILVIRFSSLGDVAMTVPVIREVLRQHSTMQITVVSAAYLQPLFEGLERCHFHPAFLKQEHKGLPGIYRLYKALSKLTPFDAVVDLHSVLRSHVLTSLFRLHGVKTIEVDKGRREKKALVRKVDKECKQLTSMHKRYADVFFKAGFSIDLAAAGQVFVKRPLPQGLQSIFPGGRKTIGVAPFAQYKEKMYPLEKMKAIVAQLASDNSVFLFGSGGAESAVLKQWEQEIPSVYCIAGSYPLRDELAVISNLDCMVSMDSANMHLASLFNVRVVSIWGATHPFAGFLGWGQTGHDIVQIDLYCRPCSIFGDKPCYRGDHACMEWIGAEVIIQKIAAVLGTGTG